MNKGELQLDQIASIAAITQDDEDIEGALRDRKLVAEVKRHHLLLERVNVRLRIWNKVWVGCMLLYFSLGATSVALSAFAATSLIGELARQRCSLVAAVCVALLGFVRPETRFKNVVRAWRRLDAERTRFVTGFGSAEALLTVLEASERDVTEDEYIANPVPSGKRAKVAALADKLLD